MDNPQYSQPVTDWRNPDYKNPRSPFWAVPENHKLEPGHPEYRVRYVYVLQWIDPGMRVLDVGCNCGQLAKNLLEDRPGVQMYGIDVVPEFIQNIRTCRQARQMKAHMVGDFSRISQEELLAGGLTPGFDVVTALEVIEHPIDLDGFKRNLEWIIKPGGLFVITTPHPDNDKMVEMYEENVWHARLWTKQALIDWLGEPLEMQHLGDWPVDPPTHIGVCWQIGEPR